MTGAYARGLYFACGVRQPESRPLIGIANSWNEMVPGHIHLRQVVRAVKEGVKAAGGIPLEFNTIALCDGICQGAGMHAVLPSREVIAASVELTARAYRLDGLVCLASCDKIVPGMLMAAARLDLWALQTQCALSWKRQGSACLAMLPFRRLMDLAYAAGRHVVESVECNVTFRHIVTPSALRNLIRVVQAIGGSTNAVLN